MRQRVHLVGAGRTAGADVLHLEVGPDLIDGEADAGRECPEGRDVACRVGQRHAEGAEAPHSPIWMCGNEAASCFTHAVKPGSNVEPSLYATRGCEPLLPREETAAW